MAVILSRNRLVNSLRLRQHGHHFLDDVFVTHFLQIENPCSLFQITLKI